MKKILTILLTLAITMNMVACGNEEKKGKSDSVKKEIKTEVHVKKEKEEVKEQKKEEDSADVIQEVVTEEPVEVVVEEPAEIQPTQTPQPEVQPTVEQEVVDVEVQQSQENYFYNEQNYAYDLNAVSIKPRYVYWENGSLVAECFVINGFSHNVFNITVDSLTLANANGLIASGAFGNLNGAVIAPYSYIVWKFTFAPEHVAMPNANLYALNCKAHVKNSY